MDEFVAVITAFPTVVFSIALVVASVFWLLALVGLVDIDMIDLNFDIDAESDASGVGAIGGLLLRFGLQGIPLTLVISAVILVSWLFCYFGTAYLLNFLPGSLLKALGGFALIFGCLAVSLPIVGMSLRPMRSIFTGETAARKDSMVGKSCTVRSLEVSETFGQGLLQETGSNMILDIRAESPNELKTGDRVALVSYDSNAGTYKVMPEDKFMQL